MSLEGAIFVHTWSIDNVDFITNSYVHFTYKFSDKKILVKNKFIPKTSQYLFIQFVAQVQAYSCFISVRFG